MINKLNFIVTPTSDLTPWVIVSNDGQPTDAENIVCDFTNMPMDATFEITFTMTDNTWQFYGNGVEFCGAKSNCQYQVSSQVSQNGLAVLVTVAPNAPSYALDNEQINSNLSSPLSLPLNPQVSTDPIGFRLVATNNKTTLYFSQDPEVVIRRPPDETP